MHTSPGKRGEGTPKVVPRRRRQLSGMVVSAGKMLRTITVTIERHPWHPQLRKQLRRRTRLFVDDPKHEARAGDRVIIEETRPLSRRKHFRLLRIERRKEEAGSKAASTAPEVSSP
ncbi:MAG: uS17 family ribosomal protein [bacterium]|nr:uS17 family ribosomal protein [bacterium]